MLKVEKKRIITFFIVALLCLAAKSFAGSGSFSSSKNEGLTSGHESAQYYCNKAEQSTSPDREANLLLCANAFLKTNQNTKAKDILSSIKNFRFEGNLLTFKQFVDARYSYNLGNTAKALTLLKGISPAKLSLPVAIEYRDLLARTYEKEGDLLESVKQRVTLDGILSDKDLAGQNNAQIWETLQQINVRTLEAAAKSATNQTLKGWLELAVIARDMSDLNALATWQSQYRGHPGEDLLPSNLSNASTGDLRVRHIALLLPLTGNLSSTADTIRDGFIAASQLHDRNKGHAPQISVIDTHNDQQIAKAYDTAISQGADMIVGPLTKNGVEQITKLASGNTPILALNYIDQSTPTNVFQLGLSPEDEARQAAERAWQDGHINALIIAQSGEWGERTTRAFQEHWESLGGRVVDATTFNPNENLSVAVKSALHVDVSESRAKQLREDLNQSLDFEPRRRQDIDMIFMVAQPREARQLPPLLAFYFAHDVPIYATASVYSGYPNPIADKDMNGVTFCDIPWNIDANPEDPGSNNPVAALWPATNQQQPRLYALGIDAYQSIALLPRLEALPNFSLSGATGKLSLTANRQLTRTLRCTKFVNGEPKRLGSHV